MVITRTISRLDSRTLRPVNVLRILVFIIINVKIMVTLSQKMLQGHCTYGVWKGIEFIAFLTEFSFSGDRYLGGGTIRSA